MVKKFNEMNEQRNLDKTTTWEYKLQEAIADRHIRLDSEDVIDDIVYFIRENACDIKNDCPPSLYDSGPR